jgi:hypothetical protein
VIARNDRLFSTVVSTSRTNVNQPNTNTAGSTVATKASNTSGVWVMKPIATTALDTVNMYNAARAAASLTVVLAAD